MNRLIPVMLQYHYDWVAGNTPQPRKRPTASNGASLT